MAAKAKYCIIGVPVKVNDETSSESATRIVKNIGGRKMASSVAILSYQDKVLDRIKIF